MKRTLCIAAAAVIALSTVLCGQSITVTSPAAGDEWCAGSSHTITWVSAGGVSGPLAIKLRAADAPNSPPLMDIVASTANSGSYSWSIPASLAAGAYEIRVRTVSDSPLVYGDSENLTIKACQQTITIPPQYTIDPGKFNPSKNIDVRPVSAMAITRPKAGDIVDPYNTVYVKWTMLGALDANVSLTLYAKGKGHAGVKTLAASTPNSGGFTWEPLALNPDPGIYAIRVRTLDGKCEALSEEFTMKEMGGIELLSPKGGETWESGTPHAVTWKRLGNIQSLSIKLLREGSWTHVLAQGIDARLGTATVVPVRDGNDGVKLLCYKIDIEHSGGNVTNPSGCFNLTGNPDLAVTNVDFPGLFNAGSDITVTVTVANKGAAAAHACQGSLKVNGASVKTFPVPAVPAGQSVSVPVTWKVSCPAKLTITIDPGGANVEPDKANNVWEKNMC